MEILKIVELLHQNELLIADLYRECARLFPDFKNDFEDFVAEEEAHAGVFARILDDIADFPQNWQPGKISVRTLEVVQQQIKEALAEVRDGRAAPRYAITALRNFEQGMGERAAEKLIETASEHFRYEVACIRNGFVNHLDRLQKLEKKIFPGSNKDELFKFGTGR